MSRRSYPAVAPAGSVLDAGCGSARLTLALADAGAAEVVGIDTSDERLAQGRTRISTHPMGARVKLIEADCDRVLPLPDSRFGAAVSRLALMIATDPVATLRELRRVTVSGGRIVSALWAPVDDNPWFALPRAAAAAAVGRDRADYARAFGRLGGPEQADRGSSRRRTRRRASPDAAANARRTRRRRPVDLDGRRDGHVRRLDAALSVSERSAVLGELQRLVADHRARDGSLRLPRAMTLVTATA